MFTLDSNGSGVDNLEVSYDELYFELEYVDRIFVDFMDKSLGFISRKIPKASFSDIQRTLNIYHTHAIAERDPRLKDPQDLILYPCRTKRDTEPDVDLEEIEENGLPLAFETYNTRNTFYLNGGGNRETFEKMAVGKVLTEGRIPENPIGIYEVVWVR